MRSSKRLSPLQRAGLCATCTAALLATHPVPSAQAQGTQLPGVVVEGATIAVPPARRRTRQVTIPQTQPQASAPAPVALPAPPVSPSPQSTGPATPQPIATGGGQPTGNPPTVAGGIRRDETGTSLTVVTSDQIAASQARFAADALRALPGVSVNRTGGFGGLTNIRLRGAESNHTLVLIDGIVANDSADGAFDFGGLLAGDIARIEILRGPQSGLFGSNALGGVINIITKDGRGPARITLRTEGGSFDTAAAGVSLSGGNDWAHGLIAYRARTTNGFDLSPIGREEDGSRLASFVARGGFKLAPNLKIDLTARNQVTRGDTDGQSAPAGQLAIATDSADTFRYDLWVAGVNVRYDMFGDRLTHNLFFNRRMTDRTNVSSFGTSSNDSATTTYGYAGTLRLRTRLFAAASHTLTWKLQQEDESFKTTPSFGAGANEGRSRLAAIAQYRIGIAKRAFVTATVRHDDNETVPDFTTWRLSATAKLGSRRLGIRPHASVGTAVKLPTLFEQFGFVPGFFQPNPNLEPEESFGFDVGVEFTVPQAGIVLDVTYFNQDLTNKIGSQTLPGFISTSVNQPGTSTREGVEVAASWKVTRGLLLSAAYTYLDAREANGQREVRRAPHSGRFDLDYTFDAERARLKLSAAYTHDTPDVAFLQPFFTPTRVTLDPYWLVSVAASYKLRQGVSVFGRLENAFDVDYQEVFGFNTPGFAAYAGLKVTFEDADGTPVR
ncbi:MAG: TonB-dependent receptor [Pseudomonadota bacterium]